MWATPVPTPAFTANLLIAGTDSLLQGMTNQAIEAFLGNSSFVVDVTCNWYFMFVSTFLVSWVLGYFSKVLVEPRFGKYEAKDLEGVQEVTQEEKRGMRNAGLVTLAYCALIAAGFFSGVLSKNGSLVGSLLLKGMIPILFGLMSLAGIAYGITVGKFKDVRSINNAMVKQMAAMGSYVVFCFFCGQFQGLFNWTHLGTLLAISGADFLKSAGFTGIPLCVTFVLVCAIVNIFMSSGSAKWAIFAPIFVPMFMLLGYHPAFAQLLYRLGTPGQQLHPHDALSVDDAQRGPGKIRSQRNRGDLYFQPDSLGRDSAVHLDPLYDCLDGAGRSHWAGRRHGAAPWHSVRLVLTNKSVFAAGRGTFLRPACALGAKRL